MRLLKGKNSLAVAVLATGMLVMGPDLHTVTTCAGQDAPIPEIGPAIEIDRLVAIVNGQPITASEIRWHIALDPAMSPGSPDRATYATVLQQMIDLRLLDQEAEKLPASEIDDGAISKYIADLIAQFPSEPVFRARLTSVGLDARALREQVKHRVEILRFIDFRFRAFVLVTPQEVEHYYKTVIEPAARARGAAPPPLDQVRGAIERDVADSKVANEMTAWFEETRARSEVVVLP